MVTHQKTLEELRQEARAWVEKNKYPMAFFAREMNVAEHTFSAFLAGRRTPVERSLRRIMTFIEQNPDFAEKKAESEVERALRLHEQLHAYCKKESSKSYKSMFKKMRISGTTFYKFFNHINASTKTLDAVERFLRNKI